MFGTITTILQFIQIFTALIPVVQTSIKAIEAFMPNAAGADKLAAVKIVAQHAFDAFEADLVKFESVWAKLVPVINAWVAVGRANGVLTAKVAQNITNIEAKVDTVTHTLDQPAQILASNPARLSTQVQQGQSVAPANSGAQSATSSVSTVDQLLHK